MGDVVRLPLTQGYEAIIDSEDESLVAHLKWTAVLKDRCVYAVRGIWEVDRTRIVYLHSVLMNTPKGMTVDHIDGDGLNNRRENMRLCTRGQNVTSRHRFNGASGFPGVFASRRKQKPWRSSIGLHGRQIHIGYFATKEEASVAYRAKAVELFGEFVGSR